MPIYNYEPAERTCPVCSTIFAVGGRGRRPLKSIYCSRRCAFSDRVRNPTVHEPSPTEAAYIAGLIDGEGSILVWHRRGSVKPSVRVVIVNTHDGVMDWLQERLGGNRNWHRARPTNYSSTPKDCWAWIVNGPNALSVLRWCFPYMVIKREKAVAALASRVP